MAHRNVRRLAGIVEGFGLVVSLVYLLNPGLGRRHLDPARRWGAGLSKDLGDGVVRGVRDARNRLPALAAGTWGRFTDTDGARRRLAARVRAALGRYTGSPRAIAVTVEGRRVTLRGDVLGAELNDVLEGALSVRGVRGVVNRLIAHEQPDIPALQGGRPAAGERGASRWATSTSGARFAAGMLGGALLVLGARRHAAHRPTPGVGTPGRRPAGEPRRAIRAQADAG